MKVIDGALRMCGCTEDRSLVVLQDLEPRIDIGGMIFAVFKRQTEIGTACEAEVRFARTRSGASRTHRNNERKADSLAAQIQ